MIKKAGSVLGLRLESFESVVERTLNKRLSIIDNDQHPLHHSGQTAEHLSHMLLQLRCPKDTYRKSLLPPHCTITAKTLVIIIIIQSQSTLYVYITFYIDYFFRNVKVVSLYCVATVCNAATLQIGINKVNLSSYLSIAINISSAES